MKLLRGNICNTLDDPIPLQHDSGTWGCGLSLADGDRGEKVGRDVDGRFGSSRSASLEKCGLYFPQSCQSLTPQHLNYSIIIQNMHISLY